MASEREQFLALVQRGDIKSSDLSRALSIAHIAPDIARWRQFIDSLLLWLGASAIASGVVFFVAYNWDAMGRFAKFALVQVLMVAAVGCYVWFREHQRIGKVSLFVASILLGVLLALYGQTYQTGADPWELFATWAVLMLPWVFIARFAPLWLLLVALINLALLLYSGTFRPQISWIGNYALTVAFLMVLVNGIALAIWEWRRVHHDWMTDMWSPKLLFTAAGVPATILAIDAVMSSLSFQGVVVILIWAALLSFVAWFYQRRRPDLFMLAGVCGSIIVVVIAWMIENLFDRFTGSGGEFLLMALVTIAMGATAAYWLRKTHRAMYKERA